MGHSCQPRSVCLFLAALTSILRVVGPDAVAADPTDLAVYSYDASLAAGRPEAVVFPETTEQVAAVVRLARAAGLPVVPRGFGTNLSGGSVPAQGGIVVCLTRMNRILEIRPERRRSATSSRPTRPARRPPPSAATWPKTPEAPTA